MTSLIDIISAVALGKAEIKTAVAAKVATAEKGTKVPVRQHENATLQASLATQAYAQVKPLGYEPASARFTKTGDFVMTFRPQITLAQRMAKYAATTAKRKAVVEARRAAKVAVKTPAPVAAALAAAATKFNLSVG